MKSYFNDLVQIDDPLQLPPVHTPSPASQSVASLSDLQAVMSVYYEETLSKPKESQLYRSEDDISAKLSIQAVMISLPEVKTLVELVLSREVRFNESELGYLPQVAHSIRKKIEAQAYERTQKETKYILIIKENMPDTTDSVAFLSQSHCVLAKTEFKQRKVLSRVKEAVKNLLFGLDSFSTLFESKESSSLDQIVDFVLKFSYLFESRKAQIHDKMPLRMLAQYLQTHLGQLPEDYRASGYRKLYYELVAEFKPRPPSHFAQLLLICKQYSAINSMEKDIASIKQELKLLQSSQRDKRFLLFVEEAVVQACVFHEDSGLVLVTAQKQCPHSKFESTLGSGKRRQRRSSFLSHLSFRKSLKNPAHIFGHTETIEEFIQEFGALESVQTCLRQDRDPHSVRAAFCVYMELVKESMDDSEIYRGKKPEERAEIMEQVEAFLTRKLYNSVFPKEPLEADRHFHSVTMELAWVQPLHLGISFVYPAEMWVSAIGALRDLDDRRSAAGKLACLEDCFRQIIAVLELCGNSETGSGDSVPIAIYLLLQTQPTRMHSNLNFIMYFRNPAKMIEEGGFCFTAIQSAIAFIENISAASLGISEDEFRFRKWGQVRHILVIAPPQPELSLQEIHRRVDEQDTFLLEVCRLLLGLIAAGEAVEMSQAAAEFHEDGFLRKKWAVQPVFGPATPLPILVFETVRAQTNYPTPSIPDLHSFLESLFLRLRLPREVVVLAVVYIERLIAAGAELRTCTWKPVLLSCLLIASKTWEDVSAQNVDFSDTQKMYTLQGINKMERALAIQLQWRFFVSPEEYADTFYALKHRQRTEQQRQVFKRTAPNLHE